MILGCYNKSAHYPQNCKENLREKTLEVHLRVGDCTPTILYKILLIFLYSYLSNSILIERFLVQTHTTPNLSVVSCFGAFGQHWRSHTLENAIEANCEIWITSEDMTR